MKNYKLKIKVIIEDFTNETSTLSPPTVEEPGIDEKLTYSRTNSEAPNLRVILQNKL